MRPNPKPPYRYPINAITLMRADVWQRQLSTEPSYATAHPDLSAHILEGITQGVRIGFVGNRSLSRYGRNLRSAEDEGQRIRDMVTDIIEKDVASGKKAGPFDEPPFEHFTVSPIGAVPKGMKIRVIHHLSFPFGGDSVNASIPHEDLELGRFDEACDAVRTLGRGCSLCKIDVEAAYKQVPVHPEDRPLLGLKWNGKYYYELVLPFGLRSSGVRWELYAAALHHFFRFHIRAEFVIHYVDDFLFVAADRERASAQLAAVQALCARLGVPISPTKTEGPATKLTFLGIELDTIAMEARLPDDKRDGLLQLLQHWDGNKVTASQRELQSLCGKLNFAAKVVRRGRAYTRRLIRAQRVLKARPGAHPDKQFPLSHDAKQDMRWWREFVSSWNGVGLLYEREWTASTVIELFTDACGTGYGGCFGTRWFRGQWTPEQLKRAQRKDRLSMPFLELHALVYAATVWGNRWKGMKITFRTDCQPASFALSTMSSNDSDMQRLLRFLDLTAARHGFDFRTEWVAGETNIVADYLSRVSDHQFSLARLRELLPRAEDRADPIPLLPPYADM
jgi:hypothetical protein